MPLLASFMVPHPPLIVPQVGRGGEKEVLKTIASYEKIADEIIYIDSGRILLSDSVENIRKNYYRISEEELNELSEETRNVVLGKCIKQHQYYVYDVSSLGGGEPAGSPALLSDVLSYLRKGK